VQSALTARPIKRIVVQIHLLGSIEQSFIYIFTESQAQLLTPPQPDILLNSKTVLTFRQVNKRCW